MTTGGVVAAAPITYKLMPVQGKGKGKGKVVSVNARKAYKWKSGIVPLILNFDAAWECGQLHDMAALSPERTPMPVE